MIGLRENLNENPMKNCDVLLVVSLVLGCVFASRSTSQVSQGAANNSSNKFSTQTVRKELEAMYATQDEAIRKSDFKAFISTLAPDYSIKMLSGDVFNREQVEGFVKADMAKTKSVEKSLSSIDSLTVSNNQAVVIVTHEASRVLDDAQGQPHKWENKVVHKETWTKTTEGWKIQHLEELKQIYLLRDGKPLRS